MNFTYSLYRYLTTGLYFSFSPAYWLFEKVSHLPEKSMKQRLGKYSQKLTDKQTGMPRIWIHAASVGEINAAESIIEELYKSLPTCRIILSTTTRFGLSSAIQNLGNRAHCIYAPIDFILSVRRALRFFRPDILVCIETEIWPNWLHEAQKMGVKTAIVNGRISARSIKNYYKIRSLFSSILRSVDAFSMIRREDAARIKMLGALEDRIEINGNSKYDLLIKRIDSGYEKKMRRLLRIHESDMVLVAGSTRTHEEEIILDAYREICHVFPDIKLIIAPRHIERARNIKKIITKRRLECQLRTKIVKNQRIPNILILDTIGELQAAYSIASVAFCGGSLVPLGGHNILEAAVLGKHIFYGPHMDDFRDAKELMEKTGGGTMVRNSNELAQKALDLLSHPEKAEQLGSQAKNAVLSNKGAAKKHAEIIQKVLKSCGDFKRF